MTTLKHTWETNPAKEKLVYMTLDYSVLCKLLQLPEGVAIVGITSKKQNNCKVFLKGRGFPSGAEEVIANMHMEYIPQVTFKKWTKTE